MLTRDDIILGVMRWYDPKKYIFVPDAYWGIQHPRYGVLPKTDLLVISLNGGVYGVFVKDTADDIKATDKRHPLFRKTFLAIPKELKLKFVNAMENMPWMGWFIVSDYGGGFPLAHLERDGYRNYESERWNEEMVNKAAYLSAIRIRTLYQKLYICNKRRRVVEEHNNRYEKIQTRQEYNVVLRTGMLKYLFPELTGDWIIDRKMINNKIK